MGSLSPDNRADNARFPGQDSSDGRNGDKKQGRTGPCYLYYRIYAQDGVLKSKNPIYTNDPFISRTPTKEIAPPRTALSAKNHLCRIESFRTTSFCALFESLSSQTAIDDNFKFSTRGDSGPGLSEEDPVIVVVGSLDDLKFRSLVKVHRNVLSDDIHMVREPRYLYYFIYKEKDGAMRSKMCFDEDDDKLGRVDVLSIAPPHTVASLNSRVHRAEGCKVRWSLKVFKDNDGEEQMNNDDHLSLLAETYPGCEKDDPIAIVCEDLDEEDEWV